MELLLTWRASICSLFIPNILWLFRYLGTLVARPFGILCIVYLLHRMLATCARDGDGAVIGMVCRRLSKHSVLYNQLHRMYPTCARDGDGAVVGMVYRRLRLSVVYSEHSVFHVRRLPVLNTLFFYFRRTECSQAASVVIILCCFHLLLVVMMVLVLTWCASICRVYCLFWTLFCVAVAQNAAELQPWLWRCCCWRGVPPSAPVAAVAATRARWGNGVSAVCTAPLNVSSDVTSSLWRHGLRGSGTT